MRLCVDAKQSHIGGDGLIEMVQLSCEVGIFESMFGVVAEFPGFAVGGKGLGPFEAEFVDGAEFVECAG